MYCAPKRQGSSGPICLNMAELRSIAALYNQESSKNIKTNIPQAAFKTQESLIAALDKVFCTVCKKGEDHCWIEQPLVKKSHELYNSLQKVYRPPKPEVWRKKPREWLNTYDILHVMNQYKESHKDFDFLGVFPVDFAQIESGVCSLNNMCNFDIDRLLKEGKNKFGIILNLDKHNQPGSHWVACFCNLDHKSPQYGICYFDSGGVKPPRYILDFIKLVTEQNAKRHTLQTQARPFKATYNPTQKQFQNTECGVFSIVFITYCLEHHALPFRTVRAMINHDSKDNIIHKKRDKFWRPLP